MKAFSMVMATAAALIGAALLSLPAQAHHGFKDIKARAKFREVFMIDALPN
jgi:hypothetical protein